VLLYVTDPLANRVLAVDISDEGTVSQLVFTATNQRYLASEVFNLPIDIAAAQPEVSARNFRQQHDAWRRIGFLRAQSRQQFDRAYGAIRQGR
jgi:hypothetical protein